MLRKNASKKNLTNTLCWKIIELLQVFSCFFLETFSTFYFLRVEFQMESIIESRVMIKEEKNVCVFCLEGGDLIHICSCSVISHKECALEYIRYIFLKNHITFPFLNMCLG